MFHADLGIRRIVALASLALILVVGGAAGSLVMLTSSLGSAAADLRETVRAARLAREAQIDLLLHEQSDSIVQRAALERELTGTLERLAQDRARPSDAATERARRATERYLAVAGDTAAPSALQSAAFRDAFDALEPATQAARVEADRALKRAVRLDRSGDAIGGATLAVIGAAVAIMLIWTQRSLLTPILEAGAAMDRFAGGDLAARVAPRGPPELRRIGTCFNAMAAKLEEQHRHRLTHVAAVAHDLRNPLMALQLASSIALDERLPPDSPIRHAFAVSQRQIARLNRMVSDLLEAARIDAGQLSLRHEVVDVRESVDRVVELFATASPRHPLRIERPLYPVRVVADPLRIEQVLTNLVSNAIKYSPRGGEVSISVGTTDEAAQIAVRDCGVGIEESELERVFEPFRRGGISTESIPGVGLGLWTARRISEALGGALRATSDARGSTFTLTLPLAEATDARGDAHGRATGCAAVPETAHG